MADAGLRRGAVRVHGRRVPYLAGGSGPPVVLVHGLAGSTRWWRRTIPALLPHQRVYLVDLPGFGALARQRPGFILAEAAAWLGDWLAALGVAPVDLIAHSMGAYLAVRLAAGRPALVRRLVLVDPAGVPSGRAFAGHFAPLLATGWRAHPTFLPILVADALRAGPWTLWRAGRDLLAADVRADLPAIRAPVLLIWGARDTLMPPALGALWHAGIPDARLLVLPRAGHVPRFDQPRAFNAALLAFLAGRHAGA